MRIDIQKLVSSPSLHNVLQQKRICQIFITNSTEWLGRLFLSNLLEQKKVSRQKFYCESFRTAIVFKPHRLLHTDYSKTDMDSSSGRSFPSSNPWSDSTLFDDTEHAGHRSTDKDFEMMDWVFASRDEISFTTPIQSPISNTWQAPTPLQSPTPRPHSTTVVSPTPLRSQHSNRLSNISMHADSSPNRSSLHAYPPVELLLTSGNTSPQHQYGLQLRGRIRLRCRLPLRFDHNTVIDCLIYLCTLTVLPIAHLYMHKPLRTAEALLISGNT